MVDCSSPITCVHGPSVLFLHSSFLCLVHLCNFPFIYLKVFWFVFCFLFFFTAGYIFSEFFKTRSLWCKFNLSDRNNVKIRCCSIHFQCIDAPPHPHKNGCRLDPPPWCFSGRGIWTALLNQEMINLCNLLFKLFCNLYRIYVNVNCTLIFF